MSDTQRTEKIQKLFNRGQTCTFERGAVIIGNNPTPNGVYLITSGYVKVYSISDSGDEYMHIIYGQGEIFPLTWAYLGASPASLFIEALSQCQVQRISKDWFNWLIMSDAELNFAVSQQLALQFQAYEDRLDNLEYKKASERIAYRLLFLASRFGDKYEGGILIDAPITHDLFANSINLARETVSRQLELLEHKKIIGRLHNHFIIKDVDGLLATLSKPPNFINWHLNDKK